MKVLTKGIYYLKPKKGMEDYKELIQKWIDRGLKPDKAMDKVKEYVNPDFVMIWHDCEKLSRRQGTNRVSLRHIGTDGDVSHYECPHCDFHYDLDNNLALIVSTK